MFGGTGKEVEKQRQAHRLESLGQFAGGIAHDFNNILSIIEGYTRLAMRHLQEGTLQPQELEKILLSTQRGAGLTRQLLAFGREKLVLDERTELCTALAAQRVLLSPLLGEDIRLYLSLPDQEIWIAGSTDQITQIILNLALNARDAMAGKGELSIIAQPCPRREIPSELRRKNPAADYALISVIDTGAGIAPEHMLRIFDPFFTTKPIGQGTGLGLSVLYGLVEQMQGHVRVHSEVGRGTAFDIFLPVIGMANMPSNIKVDPLLSLEGKTVLLAEDETELRDILSIMLSDMKLKVLTASNGNEALALQEMFEGEIDFLLTDVVMPEMDGVRLADLFKVKRPNSNVVYMSGYPFMDGLRHTDFPESADFIAKPLQEEKVRQILARALARQQERKAREAENQPSAED